MDTDSNKSEEFVQGTPPPETGTVINDADVTIPPTPSPAKVDSPPHAQTHSRAAEQFMVVRTPANTTRANMVSLRALSRYVTSVPGFIDDFFKTEPHLRDYILSDEVRRQEWELAEMKKLLFTGEAGACLPDNYASWTKDQLKRVRFRMIEFVVNYRSVRDEKEIKPSTMKGYILGIQRAFRTVWKYNLKLLEGEVFNDPEEGLMAVIDNKFALQQSKGQFTESHNVLSREDLDTIYSSKDLSRTNAKGFQARLIFDIALVTAMRTTALMQLKVSQFKKLRRQGEDVWKVRSKVGNRFGASKTSAGGWKAVRDKPTEIFILNRPSLDGKLNIFDDVDDYMRVRESMDTGTDRFFGHQSEWQETGCIFKRQHLGRNSFTRIVKQFFKNLGITGDGMKSAMCTHGLRGTVTTLLLEAGHADSSVAMRTGHRHPRSLKHYQNLGGALGQRQQHDILKTEGVVKRELSEAPVKCPGVDSKKPKLSMKEERAGKENDSVIECARLDEDETVLVPPSEQSAQRNVRLLADIQSITGGTFNVKVESHHHYC